MVSYEHFYRGLSDFCRLMIAEYIIKNEKNVNEMEIKEGFPISAMIDGTL
jgi:hypothetical protein